MMMNTLATTFQDHVTKTDKKKLLDKNQKKDPNMKKQKIYQLLLFRQTGVKKWGRARTFAIE